jgi:Golgi phosphoprotein 3 (GPP34)
MLSIPEEVLLLRAALMGKAAARPKRDLHALANEPLAAGRLIELVLVERVTIESRRHRLLWREDVVATETTPTGDALLDDVLERLAAADARPCAYWIKHVARGSEAAYWDRLVAKSLLRPDMLGSDASRHVADMDAVTDVTDRIRAVLAQPEAASLRDVALATLLAHTQSLFGVLNNAGKLTPVGLVRGYRTQQRDDRRARQALDEYERFARAAAGPGSAQQATAAAHSIACIAKAAAGFRGSGPG